NTANVVRSVSSGRGVMSTVSESLSQLEVLVVDCWEPDRHSTSRDSRLRCRGCSVGSAATILHADLDAFYASVEQLLDPRLRGRPIAVGGGVVLAASYEARAFGIRSGMPGRRARQLCPDLVFVGGHFDEYQRLGDAAVAVLNDFTPAIERISIDEAFADV